MMPLIEAMSKPGVPVIDTNRARNSEHWQREVGDFLASSQAGGWLGLEVKTEQVYTGNLFVEAWSNKAARRWRDGWVFTLGADLLFSVYLDVRAAFVLDLWRLRHWAVMEGRMLEYPEKTVHRYADGEQKNRTTGYPVPWAHLAGPVGFQCYRVRDEDGRWVRCDYADLTRGVRA